MGEAIKGRGKQACLCHDSDGKRDLVVPEKKQWRRREGEDVLVTKSAGRRHGGNHAEGGGASVFR